MLFGGAADGLEKSSTSTMKPAGRQHQLRNALAQRLVGHAGQRSSQLAELAGHSGQFDPVVDGHRQTTHEQQDTFFGHVVPNLSVKQSYVSHYFVTAIAEDGIKPIKKPGIHCHHQFVITTTTTTTTAFHFNIMPPPKVVWLEP